MAIENNTATGSIALDLSRANMIFLSIKDIAEELESAPDIEFEAVKKLLSIVGMADLGYQLTNNAATTLDKMAVTA